VKVPDHLAIDLALIADAQHADDDTAILNVANDAPIADISPSTRIRSISNLCHANAVLAFL
jgi:hypothetical protein